MGLGKWDIEIRTEFALDNEVNKRVSFLQYQHSNIPLFHVRGINIKPQKIHLISISCRISETLNYGGGYVRNQESCDNRIMGKQIVLVLSKQKYVET